MTFTHNTDITASLTIEAHLASGRFADLHKGIDRAQREGLLVWVFRNPFTEGSKAAQDYISRLEAIQDIRPALCKLRTFGIDAAGTGFAIFPNLDGYSITEGNVAVTEAERRFVACLRLIDKLHSAGIFCGDICGSSFWVNRSGEIDLVGIMGTHAPLDGNGDEVAHAIDTIPYLAPEQRVLNTANSSADVFALGVLGYYLLTTSYPYGLGIELLNKQYSLSMLTPLSDKVDIPPVWASEVLWRCLDPDAGQRYQTAGEILKAISAARERSVNMQMAPATVSSFNAPRVAQPTRSITTSAPLVAPKMTQTSKSDYGNKRTKTAIFTLLILVVCVAGFFVGIKISKKPDTNSSGLASDVNQPEQFGLPAMDMEQVLESLASGAGSVKERMELVNRLKDVDDPLAQHALVQTALQAQDSQLQDTAERVIIDRGRRQGLVLASEQVRQWLRTVQDRTQAKGYENVIKILDISIPAEERNSLLRAAYVTQPQLVVRLAAALAFDLDQLEEFHPLLSALIGDKLDLPNSDQYSSLALIMGDGDLSLMFEDRVNQRRDSLTDIDITWLMEVLGKRLDVNIRAVANLALSRKLVSPLKASLLELVRDRTDLSPEIAAALINAAVGTVSIADIQAIGRWYDQSAEPILLSIMAISQDKEVLAEAFDTLAGKSPTRQPSANLVRWVRTNVWEARVQLARSIGVLGLQELIEPTEQIEAFKAFGPFLNNNELLELLLEAEAPELLRYLLINHGHRLNLNTKLAFIRHKSSTVRLTALDVIDTNDVGALKMIVDSYELEKDPVVREKYNKFWVIKERKK